ncbi:MAG: MYXO-CTERM sorting domain-containing protein, partial [Nannocystaceae bacterium]
GVDIDRFDISAALAFGDTSVDVTYQAGTDKWWIAYNIVGIDVYEPVFSSASYKNSSIVDDLNDDGIASPGDTVRYAVRLANTGTAPGVVTMTDMVPAEAASWTMVDLAGGVDASTADTVIVQDIPVDAGLFAEVLFDVVIGDVEDETPMNNSASFDASPEGDLGSVTAAPVLIRVDGDEDGVFDNDDNCVMDYNPSQADEDFDFIGDACDPDFGGTGTGTTGAPMDTGTDTDGDTTGETDAGTGGDTDTSGESGTTSDDGGTTGDDSGGTGDTGGTDGGGDGMADSVGADTQSEVTGDSFGLGDGNVDGCGCALDGRQSPSPWLLAGFALLPWIRRRRRC